MLFRSNTDTSFILTATLSSSDSSVSPIISDSGLSVYAMKWDINNAELSNSMITLASGGSGYHSNTTVTVSAPDTANGVPATASANISGGVVQSVWFTSNGSGYLTTPTITVTDPTPGTPGSGASVYVVGETSFLNAPNSNVFLIKFNIFYKNISNKYDDNKFDHSLFYSDDYHDVIYNDKIFINPKMVYKWV